MTVQHAMKMIIAIGNTYNMDGGITGVILMDVQEEIIK